MRAPARVLTATNLVDSLPNKALWLRSDLGVTDAGAGAVSAWADQSGNGYNVTQATASERPTLVASDASYNGRPSINFDGGDSLGGLITLANPLTAYFVGHTTSTDNNVRAFLLSAGGLSGQMYRFSTVATNEAVPFGVSAVGANKAPNVPRVWCATLTATTVNVYINSGATLNATGAGAAVSHTSVVVGNHADGSAFGWGGPIAELILFSVEHDSTTRGQVVAELGALYGIAVS